MIPRSDLYLHLRPRGWTLSAFGDEHLLETAEDAGVALLLHKNGQTDLLADYTLQATFHFHCPTSIVTTAADLLIAERRVGGTR